MVVGMADLSYVEWTPTSFEQSGVFLGGFAYAPFFFYFGFIIGGWGR